MTPKTKYFNFPVQLLNGFMTDHLKVLNDIMCYGLYYYVRNINFPELDAAIEASFKHFEIEMQDPEKAFKAYMHGYDIFNSIPENSPRTGVTIDTFFEFKSNHKDEFDKLCLLGYLALKSIAGPSRSPQKTNNGLFFSRMDGRAETIPFDQLSDGIRQYTITRDKVNYWSVKIREELERSWHVKFYGRKMRGFFFGIRIEKKAIMKEAEKQRKKYKDAVKKKEEQAMLADVLKDLN